MRRTPWNIRYAERRDLQNGPDVAMAMAEDVASLFDGQYDDLAVIRGSGQRISDRHSFDGYTPWPRGPRVSGSTSGTSDLSTSGIAFVSDRVRHLGDYVLADLVVLFAIAPSLSGDLMLQLPYESWSTESVVGSAVFRNPQGISQLAFCEQFGDSDFTRFTLAVNGDQIDSSTHFGYYASGALMTVSLMYESFEALPVESS